MSALPAPILAVVRTPAAPRSAGLCPWEDGEAFDEMHESFISSHKPCGPVETSLVQRLVWIEWRRQRLLAAEAAVHVAIAFDRAGEDQTKRKTLIRVGANDYKTRDQISIAEILRGSDRDDAETVTAITEGVADVEAAIELIDAGKTYDVAVARLDEDMRDWWAGELAETENDKPKYSEDCTSLRRFLAEDGLPWRQGWLKTNSARPAIRAQAIAESFDPPRIRQLWEMESRLDRQFEKALSMLIRLQEMRTAAGAPS